MTETSEAVTVVVTHRIKPGCEHSFEEWLRGISSVAGRYDGYRGHLTIPCDPESQDRHVAFRFDSLQQLNAFWASPDYETWRGKLMKLVSAPSRYRQEIGIEHWFMPPNGAPAPSRRKMTVVVFLAILPLVTFISPRLAPWLREYMPAWIAGVINTAVIVSLMSYVAVPLITRLLGRWLRPSQ